MANSVVQSAPRSLPSSVGRPRKYEGGWRCGNKRIYITNESFEKWRSLRAELGLPTDDAVACYLLAAAEGLKAIAHGTFVGSMRLEHDKPQQIPIDITISFGASTRTYTLRKRPQAIQAVGSALQDSGEAGESISGLLGLPESETEMDDLTQYNTAHNRQISTVGISEEDRRPKRRKKKLSISVNFNNDIEVINPEDIDPSVGRFRNMVQSSFIPSSKRQKTSKEPFPTSPTDTISPTSKQKRYELPKPSLYDDISGNELGQQISPTSAVKSFSSDPLSPMFNSRTISAAPPVLSPKERIPPLPDVKASVQQQNRPPSPVATIPMFGSDTEPQKKKYAKEAWPGKRPTPLLL